MFGAVNCHNLKAATIRIVCQKAFRGNAERRLFQNKETVCAQIGQALAVDIVEPGHGHARIGPWPVCHPVAEIQAAGKTSFRGKDQLAIYIGNAAMLNAPKMIKAQRIALRVAVVGQKPVQRKGRVHLQGKGVILQMGRVVDIAHRNQGPAGDDLALAGLHLVEKGGCAHKTRFSLKADVAVGIPPYPAMLALAKTSKAQGARAVGIGIARFL